MTISKGRFIITVIAAFAAGIVLSLAALALITGMQKDSIGSGGASSDGAAIDQSKLAEINAYIDKYYLEDYEKEDLVDNAYRGYVAGLGDPYSAYMTKEEYDNYTTEVMGTYSGVGITFERKEEGSYSVVSISKDSPAEKAGIKPGDLLLEVDGKTYTSIDVMATHIRGKKGTKVELTYSHNGEKNTVTLVRDTINQQSVDYKMLDDQTGYIQITQFIESTADDFDKALKDIEGRGAKHLVLDLRNNGGGLVDDAIRVADDFLDAGVACYVSDKDGNTEEYKVKDGKTDLDTVILVNENSASASEILTAAMQDNGYQVVGTKTFGKGIIQTDFTLPDGDALKLTILEYLSPKKHKVHEKGIKPDVKVKDDEDTEADEQLDKALTLF